MNRPVEPKPVTVLWRDGQWICWGCHTPVDLPEMPPAAYEAGSAQFIAVIPHKPGCVTDFPDDTLPSMALWLARHMQQVRQHEAAADIVAEVTAAVARAVHVIDRPAQRVYAGPCDCGTDLLTWPGHTQVTCPACGTTHSIAERQERMRTQLDDYLGTAVYAAAILPGIGIHVSAGTIRVWASRHRLAARSVVPAKYGGEDQPIYRLGDIIDLALERDQVAG